jgi:hypothetical protein
MGGTGNHERAYHPPPARDARLLTTREASSQKVNKIRIFRSAFDFIDQGIDYETPLYIIAI